MVHKQLELSHPSSAKAKWNQTEQTEAGIDQPPPDGNPASCAERQSVRNHQHTCNHAKAEEPRIAHRVTQRSNKRYGDDEMAECQPVGAAIKKRGLVRSVV